LFTLEEILRILDGIRGDAIQAVESPPEDYRTEFGFGRATGMLQALRESRDAFVGITEERQRAEEEKERE
jgi:phosphoribosyl 1,2-cyclic phosphodiesterase